MIRVLHVVGEMNRGGIETFIMNVYRKINRDKVQFDFLTHSSEDCYYNEEIKSLGGKIYSITPRYISLLKNRKSLDEFFNAHPEYKIIHQHISSLSYIEPLKFAKKHKVPIRIIHGHSTKEGGSFIHKYIHSWNQKRIKSFATDYFACSDEAAKWLFGKKQYDNEEYTIINNGIDVERFVYNSVIRKEIRRKLGVGNKFVIGHVGRFAHPKNHNYLLNIFKALQDVDDKFVLILVGDGELREQIEQKILKLGLQNKVILTGMRSDIAELLQAMDVFIMPSLYEGLPVTLIEAQASGLRCVVSDNITKSVKITELIEYISLEKGPSYWAERIKILSNKNDRTNTITKIVESKFDVKEVSDNLQKYYIGKFRELV